MKAQVSSSEENSILTQIMKEILGWFLSNSGKHRNLLTSQLPFADGYSIDPKEGNQQRINIYNISTYQPRKDPAIIIQVGSTQTIKTGLGISVEHSAAGNELNCLQKRNVGKYKITLVAESGSDQTTNKLARILGDIFIQHIPEYYQGVLYGDSNNSQIIFPQEYNQSDVLSRDMQIDSNVERIYRYSINFEVEYESIRFIPGYEKIQLVNQPGRKILEHDLQKMVKMGELYTITVKTNLLGVKLYSSKPEIFKVTQLSGPHGEGDGDRIYRGHALRVGPFSLKLQDLHMRNISQTDHSVEF